MSLYESFLKEAVETSQIVKDELKNDPVSSSSPINPIHDLISPILQDIQTYSSIRCTSW